VKEPLITSWLSKFEVWKSYDVSHRTSIVPAGTWNGKSAQHRAYSLCRNLLLVDTKGLDRIAPITRRVPEYGRGLIVDGVIYEEINRETEARSIGAKFHSSFLSQSQGESIKEQMKDAAGRNTLGNLEKSWSHYVTPPSLAARWTCVSQAKSARRTESCRCSKVLVGRRRLELRTR
jgi:hypothetical protein